MPLNLKEVTHKHATLLALAERQSYMAFNMRFISRKDGCVSFAEQTKTLETTVQ